MSQDVHMIDELLLNEVSIVDNPANEDARVLLLKSASTDQELEDKDIFVDEKAKGVDNSNQRGYKGKAMLDRIDMDRVQHLKENPSDASEDEISFLSGAVLGLHEQEQSEKAGDGMSEVEDMKKFDQELEKRDREIELLKFHVKKADALARVRKDFNAVPGSEDDVSGLLVEADSLSEASRDTLNKVLSILQEAMVEKSQAASAESIQEAGSGQEMSPQERFDALVKAYQEKQGVSKSDAIVAVGATPEGYALYNKISKRG